MSEVKKNPPVLKSIVARFSGWLLAVLMTAVVTLMLLFLAGVFHSKVPSESASVPITLDPIFSGLGWSLIFGLIASTGFTLFVIPVSYWLLKANRDTT